MIPSITKRSHVRCGTVETLRQHGVPEDRIIPVAIRELVRDIERRPGDGQRRIIPADAALMLGRVEVADLVHHGRVVFEGAEPVRESRRDVEEVMILTGQRGADPLAEGR